MSRSSHSTHAHPISFWQKNSHWIGLLVLVFALIFFAYKAFFSSTRYSQDLMNEDAVLSRISPQANLGFSFTAKAVIKVFANGEAVYQAVCSACHAAGTLNSPKLSDKVAWGPRIGQGYAKLFSNAQNGIRQMPARGGDASLSDYDLARALVYMANAGGASFPEPVAPKVVATAEKPTENK